MGNKKISKKVFYNFSLEDKEQYLKACFEDLHSLDLFEIYLKEKSIYKDKLYQDKKNEKNFWGWIGVDLDGTLAFYENWKGIEHIGEPISPMVEKVKWLLKKNIAVKVFTARAEDEKAIPYIKSFLKRCGLPEDLEITNQKDYHCIEIWDDRARQVKVNEGTFC